MMFVGLTLSEEGIGVSVVQVLTGRKAANKVVSVASVVTGAADLAKMGHLVEDGGSLVLSVASTAESGKTTEEKWAVDHLGGRRGCVCQDTAGASAEDISAVVAGVTRGGGAALRSNAVEYCLNSGGGAGRGAFEVLVELGSVVDRSGGGGARKRCAVGERGPGSSTAGTSAVRLDGGALGQVDPVATDLSGLCAVYRGRDLVAGEGNGTSNGGRVEVGVGERTLGDNIEVTSNTQVVGDSDVKSSLNGLACLQDLESRLVEVLSADTKTDTLEGNLFARLEDLDLLDVRVIKEGTSLEKLEVLGTSVLDGGLDLSVAGDLKGYIERGVALVKSGGDSTGQRSQSSDREDLELHDERM
jgi:hypothetical protein